MTTTKLMTKSNQWDVVAVDVGLFSAAAVSVGVAALVVVNDDCTIV